MKNVLLRLARLVIIVLLVPGCNVNQNNLNKDEEKTMPLEIKDIAYPVPFANYQLNSLVPVKAVTEWDLSWSRKYTEIHPEYSVAPHSVHIKDNNIGVRCLTEMFIYNQKGKFLYQLDLNPVAPVIFGRRAFVYLRPSYQLTYQDYEEHVLGEAEPIPRLKEWSRPYLLKPTLDEVLAVVQFSGGPMRKPPRYYVYKFLRENAGFAWYHEFDGSVSHSLLTNDGTSVTVLRKNELYLFNAGDGKTEEPMILDIGIPVAASLDVNDRLLILDQSEDEGETKRSLKAFSLEGELLWTARLTNPSENQPPASGNDGRAYIIDAMQLKCIREGETEWSAALKPAENSWLTVTEDNSVVVINGNLLSLFAPDGEKIFERPITKKGDTFSAPPAIDKAGRIFVAGNETLYCFE